MNYPKASFGISENRLSPLSPLHLWRGEALRRSKARRLFRYQLVCFFAMCLFGPAAFANDQIVQADSSKNLSVATKALRDSSHADSTKVMTPADTLAGLPATTHDSINKSDTTSQAQYQSTLPVMRRDAPGNSNTPSQPKQREKFVASKDTVKSPVRKDSVLVVSNNIRGNPPARSQIKKSGVYIALGACAILGAGIAAYVISSTPGSGSAASNTGIPAPPVPPSNFAPSP